MASRVPLVIGSAALLMALAAPDARGAGRALLLGPLPDERHNRLYGRSALESAHRTYAPNLVGMWNEDLLPRLTARERTQAGSVALRLPMVGANHSVLDFYANSATREVFLPIASIKFIDDIALAFSYYAAQGCPTGLVSDYASALRFNPAIAAMPPLEVLGVPRSAISQPAIDDPAQKILKSAVYFIAAHEYAHVMYSHRGSQLIPADAARRQEGQADAFAVEVMRRIGVAPIGVVYLFAVMSRLEPSEADFPTKDAYEQNLQQRSTHPLSGSRILAVANAIDQDAMAFVRLERDRSGAEGRLRQLVPELRSVATALDDRRLRLVLERQAARADPQLFWSSCRRP